MTKQKLIDFYKNTNVLSETTKNLMIGDLQNV